MEQGRHFVRNADTSISALATIIISPRWPSDDDDDDNGGEGNNNVGGLDSSPRCTPRPIPSNPSQGGSRGAPGNDTPPPSQGKRQCPPAPKKVVEEEGTNLLN